MRQRLRLLLAHLTPSAVRSALAALSCAAVLTGLWWERPSVALVVGGGAVFAALTYGHIRGR